MDIYYYYNSLAEEKSSELLSIESGSVAKVLSLKTHGTGFDALGNNSKRSIGNCPLSGMVTPPGIEPGSNV